MKNRTIKSDFGNFSRSKIDKIKSSENGIKVSSRIFSTADQKPMIAPPEHVWDRIEKILDKQDNVRKHADAIIATSFGFNTSDVQSNNSYSPH